MRSRMRKGTTSLLGDENARLRTQIAEAKAVVTIERQLQDELSTQLTEARAEVKHRKTDREMRIAHAKTLEAARDKAEAELERVRERAKAVEWTAGENAKELETIEAERDELAAYCAYLRKKCGDLEISTTAEKAGQIMDIVEAAKYGSRTGEWRKTHEAVLAYQQQESKG